MEAAAATAVQMEVMAAPSPLEVLELDRPFVYLVVAREGGTPLVVGQVGDPAPAD